MKKTKLFVAVTALALTVASCAKDEATQAPTYAKEPGAVPTSSFSPVYQYLSMIDPENATPYTMNASAHGFLLNSAYMADKDKSPETVNFTGYIHANGKTYVSIGTPGVAGYAVADDNFTNDMQNFLDNNNYGGDAWDYVSFDSSVAYHSDGTSGSSSYSNSASYTSGIGYPLTPNKARVAIFTNNIPFNLVGDAPSKVLTIDGIGQAYGRYLNNPLSTIVTDSDEDYVYVFSPGVTRGFDSVRTANESDNTEILTEYTDNTYTIETGRTVRKVAQSNFTAGVVRINTETDAVDEGWGIVDLEAQLGGCTFSRVWHITGTNKYLLRVMDADKTTANGYYYSHHKTTTVDARFFIFDADTKTATPITGLPASSELLDSSSAIGTPLCTAQTLYIPFSLSTTPYIYAVDVATAVATKGAMVVSNYVYGVGQLEDETSGETKFAVITLVGSAYYYLTTDADISDSYTTISAINQGYEAGQGSIIHFIKNKYIFSIRELGGSDPVMVNGYKLDGANSSNRTDIVQLQSGNSWETNSYHSWGDLDGQFVYVRYSSNSSVDSKTYPIEEDEL